MEVKLTLKLDKDIIEEAKQYAKIKNTSLSRMVERFFKSLSEKKPKASEEHTPLVKELSGVIRLDPDTDVEAEYTGFLVEKYK